MVVSFAFGSVIDYYIMQAFESQDLHSNTPLDRIALPSVYGRNNDILGNSIPGFGSAGSVSSANVAQLRDELNAQAYFR